MSKHQYDIFISYRREGGFETARLLYDHLTRCGYKVFFDLESLRSGKFNKQLYGQISACKDYIVVLSSSAVQWRENRDDDWLRLEMAHALQSSCNIIPVFLRDFQFPAPGTLPEDVADIVNYEGITASMEHFDSTIKRICRNLRSKPRRMTAKIIASLLIIAALASIASGIYVKRDLLFPYPFTQQQKQDFNVLYGYMIDFCRQYNGLAANTEELLDAAENSALTGENRRFQEELQLFKRNMRKLVIAPAQDTFTLERVRMTPVDMDDFMTLAPLLASCKTDAEDTASMFDHMLSSGMWRKDDKLAYIKTEQKLLQLQNEYFAICVMAIFSKIPDSSLAEFKRELAPYLSTLPFPAGQWLKDETEIKNTLLKNIEQKENLIGELETFLGNQTHELRQERAAAIADCVANGMTQTEAEEFIDSLLSVSNPDSLTAKHAKIEEAENELAELNQKLRKKFAPSPDDPDYVLIQKISIFQKAYMPEDALQTLQLLRRKTDGNISPELCDIIEHIIKMPDPPFNYGQMVLFFEPPATEHPVYMPGDIIVKCGGKDIRTYEDYRETTGKNVEFYRFNKNSGIFEVMTAVMPEGAPRTALEDAPVPDVNLY